MSSERKEPTSSPQGTHPETAGQREQQPGRSPWSRRFPWIFGIALVIGRLLHPFGMERPSPNPFRITGILLTYVVTAALIVWGILRTLAVV